MIHIAVVKRGMMKKIGAKKNKRLDLIFIIVMLAAPVCHWLVFWLYVNINSILMAFQTPLGEWSLNSIKGVFLEMKLGDSDLRIALQNTLLYFTKDVLMLFFQLFIAYFLYKKITGYKAFRIAFYLPSIISGVAMATMFSNIIAPSGPVGIVLKGIGMEVPEFLADSRYATWTIMFYTIWLGWGGNMLILGGALARVPVDVLESARLDGISPFREVWQMILPLVWPTVSTLLILNITGLFGASGPILLFTKGSYKTTTIGYWIFEQVYEVGAGAYNTVAAAGLLFTMVGVPVIMFVKWLMEKIPAVEY